MWIFKKYYDIIKGLAIIKCMDMIKYWDIKYFGIINIKI